MISSSQMEAFQADGHDGIIGVDKDGKQIEFVAFKPTQIKSATANKGTFDPTKPSILESKKTAFVNRLLWERYP